MTTALDTNVLSGLWGSRPEQAHCVELLDRCREEGGLLISGVVYAELMAHPRLDLEHLDAFLDRFGIQAEFTMGAAVWKLSGLAFAAYAHRRRREGSGTAKRMLADFIIGAHAHVHADRLATLDRTRYQQAFPKLCIVGG